MHTSSLSGKAGCSCIAALPEREISVEDWTLGRERFAWFERTLKESSYPYNFVCIHHAVGGNAGNDYDTLYGRGG